MADDLTQDDAALAVVARHALHDEELIAAFAVGGSESDDDANRARALIDRCTACRDLHSDLVGIAVAIKADSRGLIPAPRDYRLSVNDAQRLGGRISPRGFLSRLRRSLESFGRPLGASMATLGLVGLLVGTVSFGGAAGAAPQGLDSAAASTAPEGLSENPDSTKTTEPPVAFGPMSTQEGTRSNGGGARDLFAVEPPTGSLILVGGSLLMLFAGLGLLALTFRRNR